jgi:hypothetical protein
MVGAVSLAGCSATAGKAGDATTTSAPATATSTSRPTTTTTVPTTSNLVVTDVVRSQLVAAGAALNSLPPSDYTGLRPGETYYAYDAATQTYWAGAGLLPSLSSTPAQISTQDDGAYLLFTRPWDGAWKGYAVGVAGPPEGSACPVAVPSAILGLWNWAPGSCRPPTIS